MAFEVGEVVTPVADINFNGTLAPTTGVPGVVSSRQKIGQIDDETPLYSYQVNLSEVVTFGEEPNIQSSQVFWFSESDLGGTVSDNDPDVDISTVNSAVTTAKATNEDSASAIGTLKANVPSLSPYSDTLNAYQKLAQSNADRLGATSIDTSTKDDTNRQGKALIISSDLLNSDAVILKELSENVYAFYTITSEAQSNIKQEAEQAETEEKKAAEDDDRTFQAFVEAFIDSSQASSLLIPNDEEPNQTVGGLSEVDSLKDLNPLDLITEAVELDED